MIGALILALCLLVLSGVAGGAQADPAQTAFVSEQVVVELLPTSKVKVKKINQKYGTTTLESFAGRGNVYLLEVPANSSVETTVERMANDQGLNAEPNYRLEISEGVGRFRARGVSDIEPSSQEYAISALNLSTAHDISQGEDTTVAVLDTGVQADHPKLSGRVTPGYDFVDSDNDPADLGNSKDDDYDGEVDEMFGHGTHVAGIVHLVAPKAEIMPLRVLEADGFGDSFHIAEAVVYARNHGADVINLSLGSPDRSQLLWKVIQDATKEDPDLGGVVVAAAAGNDGTSAPEYPAADSGGSSAADGVVAVTSVNEEMMKSDFANYGRWVDIAAPGDDIRSAYPVSAYATWSGTSMSTPFVSGQAALIRAIDGSLYPAEVEMKIRCSAQPLDETDPIYADTLGAGVADMGASLTQDACRPGNQRPSHLHPLGLVGRRATL
jgi:thermitase